jgi:hypothetical protein
MVQETRRIMEHIESEREQLGENLDEIESRIKDATDPKAWFNRNPGMILGAAAVSGVVLGFLITSRSSDLPRPVGFSAADLDPEPELHREPNKHLNTIKKTLDTTVAALVGLGAQKVQDFISNALPGYQQQYNVASEHHPASAWDSTESRSSMPH